MELDEKRIEDLRAQFEKWMLSQFPTLDQTLLAGFEPNVDADDAGYHDPVVNAAWVGFCAGSALRETAGGH